MEIEIKIDIQNPPKVEEVRFLRKMLNEENINARASNLFGFFVRDEVGDVIAGCNGVIIFGAIYTEQLWVHNDYRNKGYGRKLMQEVEKYGVLNKCELVTINTMSIQNAVGFYQKLGYIIDFEKHGYINGASCYFLSKQLLV